MPKTMQRFCVALLITLTGCVTREVPVDVPVDPCHVPKMPEEPSITLAPEGLTPKGYVCMTSTSAVDLGLYLREIRLVRESLLACPLVVPE